MIITSFKKCEISIAADGSEDYEIHLKGVEDYEVNQEDECSSDSEDPSAELSATSSLTALTMMIRTLNSA